MLFICIILVNYNKLQYNTIQFNMQIEYKWYNYYNILWYKMI